MLKDGAYWEELLKLPDTTGGDGADLSNYYTKSEVNNIINNLNFDDTKYYAGKNITIDSNNVISANIQSANVDLSDYYNKQEVDYIISNLNFPNTEYFAGNNITINENNVISAIIPEYQQPDLSVYYNKVEIDEMFNNLNKYDYSAGANISIDENRVISANIKQEQVDWEETDVDANAYIRNKPELFSGDYYDLTNQPDLTIYQTKIQGNNGEVIYHNGSDVFAQFLMNSGLVVTNDEELELCKQEIPSFQIVFNTWYRFSHLNGVDNAKPAEKNAWTYDSTADTIVQPKNSESYVGFVSPKSYSQYNITVRCYSTDSDDDSIGLVAAFAKDSNGKEHTLSFIRTPGGTGMTARWIAIIDLCAFNLTSTAYGQTIIVNKSSTVPQPTSTAGWNSANCTGGTVINMTRKGNKITARCSQFRNTTLDDNTLIEIDLDTMSAQYPTLNLFKGASPWGYSNFSQPYSKYQNLTVTDPDGTIYDIPNNQCLTYNTSTKAWEVIPNLGVIDGVGVGRLSYNRITEKLFYNNGSQIIEISRSADDPIPQVQANWNETDNTSVSYIANKPEINNGTLTIKDSDNNVLGAFSANQKQDVDISLPTPKQADWSENNSDSVSFIKNKPTIPTVNDSTITIKQDGEVKGTFTTNSAEDVNIELELGNNSTTIIQNTYLEEQGIDADYYDIMVSNWQDIKNAVAFSLGYKCEKENNKWKYTKETYTKDTNIHKAGEEVTARGCRIHFLNDITITSDELLNLSHCIFYGYGCRLNATAKFYLKFEGNGEFHRIKFYCDARCGTNSAGMLHIMNNKDNRVDFFDCVFRSWWYNESNSCYLEHYHYGYFKYNTCEYNFIRCEFTKNTVDTNSCNWMQTLPDKNNLSNYFTIKERPLEKNETDYPKTFKDQMGNERTFTNISQGASATIFNTNVKKGATDSTCFIYAMKNECPKDGGGLSIITTDGTMFAKSTNGVMVNNILNATSSDYTFS